MNPWEMYNAKLEEPIQNPWETYTPQTSAKKPNLAETVLEQGMQGATFGFADELTDRMGAGAAALLTGRSYDDLLAEARMMTKDRQADQMDQRPITSIASNIAGGLLTGSATMVPKAITGTIATKGLRGAVNAIPEAGASFNNFLRGGNIASRALKGSVAGAASGGLYGAGSASDGERLEGARTGAAFGAVGGGLLPVASAGLSRLNTKAIIPNSDAIRQRAGEFYQKAEQFGGMLKPEFTNRFVDAVEKLQPQTDIGRIVGGDSAFTQAVQRIATIRNRPMTLQAAQEVDELLGDAIDGMVVDGKLTKEGKKLFDIQSTFRNMIEEADDGMIQGGREGFEALKEGRKLWGVSRRLNDVEKIINNADTFQVPATAIKTGFRALVRNPNRLRGYSPQEVKAMRRAAETGYATDLLNVFGSRLGPIMAGAGGWAAGGPLGGAASAAASYATSSAARTGATALQKGRARDAATSIAQRAGMTETYQRVKIPDLVKSILLMPPAKARAAITDLPEKERAEVLKLLPSPEKMSPLPMSDAEIAIARAQMMRGNPNKVDPSGGAAITDPIRSIPAPAKEIAVNREGVARQITPDEQAKAVIARLNDQATGMTPDIRAVLEKRARKVLTEKYGQSEFGQFISNNPDIPLTRLDEETLRSIMQMSKDTKILRTKK